MTKGAAMGLLTRICLFAGGYSLRMDGTIQREENWRDYYELADRVRMLLDAYLLTGDERYKRKGLASFYDLDREYRTTMMRYSKRPGFPDDFVVEQHTKTMNLILDAFADDLSDEWRNKIVDLLYTIKKTGYLFSAQKTYPVTAHPPGELLPGETG